MKQEFFVIGDIHGEIQLMKQMLSYWNEKEQQLILLGDLGDRGENAKETFLLGKTLVEEKGAIWVKGNHEDIILRWLSNPVELFPWYVRNGGISTINQLLERPNDVAINPEEDAKVLLEKYASLWNFLKNLPLYIETDKYIFVHAGVDLRLPDWKDTIPKDFFWIRAPFHEGKNTTGKTIIFGHTPTPHLHGDKKNTDVWEQDQKIGLDGGAVYGGVLYGLHLNQEGWIKLYEVRSIKEPNFED